MTTRFPIRYEEEVLSKHGIGWEDWGYFEVIELGGARAGGDGIYREVNDYELAAIGLEAILEKHSFHLYKVNHGNYYEAYFTGEDKGFSGSFFDCIFKAIKEIWG